MDTLLVVVAAALVFGLLVAIAMVQQLLKFRFQPPAVRRVEDSEVPPEYVRLYQSVVAELATHGFEPLLWLRVELPFVSGWTVEHQPVFQDADGVLAVPALFDALNPKRPLALIFASLFEDGRWIRTHNHAVHLHIDLNPASIERDGYCDTIDDQLALHREAIAEAEAAGRVRLVACDPDVLASAMEAESIQGYASLRANELTNAREGAQYRLLPAMRQAWRFATGSKRKPGPRSFLATSELDVPISLQVVAWKRYEELGQRQSVHLTWLWALTISAGVTLVSFAGWFDLKTAIILIVVLALHEAGHYLAMIASGYRNVRIFFLPFLGAATTGEPVKRTLAKELFVLLAGPVPGAALGIGLLLVPGSLEHPLIVEVASFLLVINVVNLLPFIPLDGGRAVHALIGDVHPTFSHALNVLALFAFLGVWMWMHEPLGLVLALIVLLSLRTSTVKLESECRRDGVTDTAGVLRRVLEVPGMTGPKARVAMKVLTDRLDSALPSVPERIIGGMVYAGVTMVMFGASAALLFDPFGPDEDWESPIRVVDCHHPDLGFGTDQALMIDGTFASAEEATRIAAEIGVAFEGYCPRSPWSVVPPTPAELAARRTLTLLQTQLWESGGDPERAVRTLRTSGVPLDEVIAADFVEHETMSEEIAAHLGMDRCSPDQTELAAHASDARVLVYLTTPADAEQGLVQHLCAQSPSELVTYVTYRRAPDPDL